MKKLLAIVTMTGVWPIASWAQIPAPNEYGVAMGHFHLYVPDLDAAKKVWVDHIGGVPAKVDGIDVVKFPGVLIFLEKGSPIPAGGSPHFSVTSSTPRSACESFGCFRSALFVEYTLTLLLTNWKRSLSFVDKMMSC